MKKLIKIDFNNTTRERKTEDSYSELYSYDKNNGSFEFEILNDTLTTEQVTALFKFTESNKIWKTTGTVEGNKVHVTFDTTLITQNETVICYLYFDEEQRTSDTFRFKFKVKVSEIDKMNRYEVKERFINNTVIVDRLDVVTKDELKEALKGLTVSTVEGVLTETRADEIYAKKSELYDDTALRQRVATLEERPDNNTIYDDSDLRGRVIALESKADNDTVYDDSDLKRRVSELEQRPDNNTVYDDSALTQRVEALESKSEGATKDDVKGLEDRVVVLENKSDKDTVYDDTALSNRVKALEDAPKVNATDFATKNDLVAFNGELNNKVSSVDFEDFKKTIPAPYNDKTLSDRVLALENKPTIGGTQIQDTGWLKVNGENAIAGNIVEIRRIGNTVHVRFRNENDYFIIDEKFYFTLNTEISGGFGSITNNSPIFSAKNNRELGRFITNVFNNRITVESMIDVELSGSKSIYINEFSYITDDPFPTNLN